jgi:hypothetical protein
MGLKKLCLTAVLGMVSALCFAPGALAWTFSASGSVACDTATGQHVVTWTIDNRSEPQTLTIRDSNRAAVPVGSTTPARATRQYTERLAGSTTGTVTLTVKGNWPSDTYLRTRTASVTLSAVCAADVCPNLGGVQQQIPTGLVKDEQGHCVPPPPIDICPNIEGIQTQVPSGMVKNDAGACVPPPPPTDVCPNIEGIQTQVPSGMVKNDSGNCVPPPPPTDVCSNLEGLQTLMPADLVLDANGQCAFLQRVVTITVEKMVEVPGPERLVSVAAAPEIREKIVTKVVVKKIKVKVKKKAKKRKLKRRVLPFTP